MGKEREICWQRRSAEGGGERGVQWAPAKEAESQSDTAGETRKPKQTPPLKYSL